MLFGTSSNSGHRVGSSHGASWRVYMPLFSTSVYINGKRHWQRTKLQLKLPHSGVPRLVCALMKVRQDHFDTGYGSRLQGEAVRRPLC